MTAIEAIEKIQSPASGFGDRYEVDEVVIAFLKDHDPACRDIAEAWEKAREEMKYHDADD